MKKTGFSLKVNGALSILGLLLTAQSSFAETKIGLVDRQKALQSVDAGKKARAQLEKEFEAKRKELQSEESDLKKATEDYRKKVEAKALKPEAQAKKQAELQERFMKFQEKTARSQSDIQQKERELTDPILSKFENHIEQIAKKKGLSVVLENNKAIVAFATGLEDITDELISSFNKKEQ